MGENSSNWTQLAWKIFQREIMMFDFDLVFQTDYVRSDLLFFFMEDRIFYMFVSFILDNLCRGM